MPVFATVHSTAKIEQVMLVGVSNAYHDPQDHEKVIELIKNALAWSVADDMIYVGSIKFGPPIAEPLGEEGEWVGINIQIASQVRKEDIKWIWDKVQSGFQVQL